MFPTSREATMRRTAEWSLIAVLMVSAAPGWCGCKLVECVTSFSGDSLIPVVSMHEMRGDRWIVQASPGYWETSLPEIEVLPTNVPMTGLVGSFAVKHEFTQHWGLGVGGSFTQQTSGGDLGTTVSGLEPLTGSNAIPGSGAAGGKLSGIYGNSIFAMVTWDPFSGPDGFRMPLSLGPLYMWQGFQFSNTFVNAASGKTETDTVNASRRFVGFFANASFDVPLGKKVYVSPGVLFGGYPGTPLFNYDYVIAQNGGSGGSYSQGDYLGEFFASIYVSALYRPWDLGFNYVITDQTASGSRSFSITLTKKWGGKEG
jgi:hypothetical protein